MLHNSSGRIYYIHRHHLICFEIKIFFVGILSRNLPTTKAEIHPKVDFFRRNLTGHGCYVKIGHGQFALAMSQSKRNGMRYSNINFLWRLYLSTQVSCNSHLSNVERVGYMQLCTALTLWYDSCDYRQPICSTDLVSGGLFCLDNITKSFFTLKQLCLRFHSC